MYTLFSLLESSQWLGVFTIVKSSYNTQLEQSLRSVKNKKRPNNLTKLYMNIISQ